MALFHGAKPVQDTKDTYFRSNTKLQAGTHDAPGEKFLVDPRLRRLFRYHFGDLYGINWVVIPKGRVVAPATNGGPNDDGRFVDFDSNQKYNALTLANGGVDVNDIDRDGAPYVRKANKAIGVAYANLYEEIVDGFNGMQPTIENEIYIELPYIPLKEQAEQIEWGSFYDVDPSRPVRAGDYVMSDENGRCIKADFDYVKEQLDAANAQVQAAADLDSLKAAIANVVQWQKELSRLHEQVIGQVWAVESPIADGVAPQGWLKWVGWAQSDILNDERWVNSSGERPSDIGSQDGFPGYPYEESYLRGMLEFTNKYFPHGIPGLTDGSRIEVPFTDLTIGTVQPGQSGRHDFRVFQFPMVPGSLTVTANGTQLPLSPTPPSGTSNYVSYVDYNAGLIVVQYDNSQGSAPVEIKATFKAYGQIPGIPTGWDWTGSVGAVRILLQK
ncbi:hypothetical protein [Alicyclobacillus shizuokensis]|uniref:hypothetical protein n=1 Tax=Alicyclobacillus shizuokensis TaxID=392014 RepID=UPI00082A491A|nr:hypothetical protein [Alicyclobacillus shizuokensis]